ncbi:MAG: hypothetical protein WCF72_15370, partial [Pseudolabrys sp.]
MSKVRMYILAAAVATAGIGLGGTFGASAVPINGNLIGATAPAPELHKVYYYNRVARRQYRRAYRRGYYGGYAYNPGCRAARKSALFPNRVAHACFGSKRTCAAQKVMSA